MKHSVAAWLLLGLSLSVPQFCRGEAKGQGLAAGQVVSPPGRHREGGWRRSGGAPGVASPVGGPEEAVHPMLGAREQCFAKSERSVGEAELGRGCGVPR